MQLMMCFRVLATGFLMSSALSFAASYPLFITLDNTRHNPLTVNSKQTTISIAPGTSHGFFVNVENSDWQISYHSGLQQAFGAQIDKRMAELAFHCAYVMADNTKTEHFKHCLFYIWASDSLTPTYELRLNEIIAYAVNATYAKSKLAEHQQESNVVPIQNINKILSADELANKNVLVRMHYH